MVFKRKKAFCTKKNLNLDEVIVFGDKVLISHFDTVLGNFPVELRLVTYNISSNTFFAF